MAGDPVTGRSVRLRWGGATDVGQVRDVNQDSMLLGPDFFVVADGMGGHQGGEVASALAIDTVSTRAPGPDLAELVTSVQEANDIVFERSRQDPSLSGMGTTFVGIAVVAAGDEELLAIVNVGDSRAYRYSNGHLEQITEDHSLVGELVREGSLTAEEARAHPQKNIVTRAVGIDSGVEVDQFQILPHTGDRYLLCSDGLTDEVDERDIASVLGDIDDPDEAARELIRRANGNGGRDNITVVIVDVVDDGGLSARASARVPDADDFSHSGEDTQTYTAVPDDAHDGHADRDQRPGSGPGDRDPADRDTPGGVPLDGTTGEQLDDDAVRRPRAITVRSVAFVVVVLALVGAGAYLVNDYGRNSYHVTVDDGEVVIYRGRAGGFLWFDPSLEERTGIEPDELPGDIRDRLAEGVNRSSLESAETYVTNLEERIEELSPPVSTTTSTTTTSNSSTTTTAVTATTAGGSSPAAG